MGDALMEKLAWGLASDVPEDATGAWGTRLIVTQDGHVDIVPDRVDQVGSEIIFDVLTREFPMAKLTQTLGDLLRSGQMSTRARGRHTLYESPNLVVRADTNASYGYCYIACWTTIRGTIHP